MPVIDALAAYERRWLAPWGATLADVFRGCEDCAATAPRIVYVAAAYVARYLALVRALVGGGDVYGWFRCPECNERRDGSARSRHLGGWAVDLRPANPDVLPRMLAGLTARQWGDYVRRETGWPGYVGLRVYPSGSIHLDLGCHGTPLCDPRRADWLEVQR